MASPSNPESKSGAPASGGSAPSPTPPFSHSPTRPPDFEVKTEVILRHLSPHFCWFHPRAAAIPGAGREGRPAVVLTLQKHLAASDHYSGLTVMRTDDLGATWSGPEERPELAWVREPGDVDIAVADVTPGWHAPARRLLAFGAQVRYSRSGEQLEDVPRAHQTAYTVHDPQAGTWTPWRSLAMPPDDRFNFARNACAQWLVEPDGTLLIPLYIGRNATEPFSVTVARYAFDGDRLSFLERGDVLALDVVRGLCEPSLARFQGRYYLTLRNDLRGYVAAGSDGLRYAPMRPWAFDDGAELGSYNTQQHWLAHSDGLFLAYTRRGAENDHIFRNRAPLFLARVDPDRLCVLRDTERVLIPERGVMLGNFGACAVTAGESWVTDAEYILGDHPHPRGGDGSLFLARVLWSRPNAA